jgi:hypothetical protein
MMNYILQHVDGMCILHMMCTLSYSWFEPLVIVIIQCSILSLGVLHCHSHFGAVVH